MAEVLIYIYIYIKASGALWKTNRMEPEGEPVLDDRPFFNGPPSGSFFGLHV